MYLLFVRKCKKPFFHSCLFKQLGETFLSGSGFFKEFRIPTNPDLLVTQSHTLTMSLFCFGSRILRTKQK